MAVEMNPSDTLLEEMARELGINIDELKMKRFFKLIKGTFPVYIMNLTRKMAPYGGEILDNFDEVTLVNNVTKSHNVTVPATKRWYLWGGRMSNGDDVARNSGCRLHNSDAKIIFTPLMSQALAAGSSLYFPTTIVTVNQLGSGAYPIPMKAGDYIRFTWVAGGVSAGGTSEIILLVSEIDE